VLRGCVTKWQCRDPMELSSLIFSIPLVSIAPASDQCRQLMPNSIRNSIRNVATSWRFSGMTAQIHCAARGINIGLFPGILDIRTPSQPQPGSRLTLRLASSAHGYDLRARPTTMIYERATHGYNLRARATDTYIRLPPTGTIHLQTNNGHTHLDIGEHRA